MVMSFPRHAAQGVRTDAREFFRAVAPAIQGAAIERHHRVGERCRQDAPCMQAHVAPGTLPGATRGAAQVNQSRPVPSSVVEIGAGMLATLRPLKVTEVSINPLPSTSACSVAPV